MPSRADVAERAGKESKPLDAAIGATQIDDALGSLFSKLTELDILDDTLILFVMDHGVAGKGGYLNTLTRNNTGSFFKC